MDYYIFRVKEGFKNLIDEVILCSLLEKEHNDYYYSQIKYLLNDISWNKLLILAKEYFKDRNDIFINDFSISFKRINEDKSDELILASSALRLHIEHDTSPLLTFLEEFNEHFVFVKKEMLEMNIR